MLTVDIKKMYAERAAPYVSDLCGVEVVLTHVGSGQSRVLSGKKSSGFPFDKDVDLPEGPIVWSSPTQDTIFEASIGGAEVPRAE